MLAFVHRLPNTDDRLSIQDLHSSNIKIYPREVSNIKRGAAELNIISTRVDKSDIQQEWACYICFIISPRNLFLYSKFKTTTNNYPVQ